MKFNFDFNPVALTSATIIAMIFATVIFIFVPALLAVMEYRMTKKDRQTGYIL